MLEKRNADFPYILFLVYVLFYSGQSIYNTYLNLYLSQVGLSYSQVGMTISISTICVLAGQMNWGIASDRCRSKNLILSILLLAASMISLMFYLGSGYFYLIAAVSLFAFFFNPIVPLLDNYTIEYIEKNGKSDYGHLRMGGTIGYCITVLLIGLLLKDDYRGIFILVSAALFLCFMLYRTLPKISGYRSRENHTSWKDILGNRTLIGLILFSLIFNLGLSFFYSFYPIYFTEIGGNSSLIGTMMFLCAVSEIPMLLIIDKIVRKIGLEHTLIIAGIVTSARWLLLFVLRNPSAAIFVSLLHGIGYTSFSYCIITYIGRSVPKDMRATCQTLNALIGTVGSKVLFGYIGGLASEAFGANRIMLASSLLMLVSTCVFAMWSRDIERLSANLVQKKEAL